jgi:hypothetical protein
MNRLLSKLALLEKISHFCGMVQKWLKTGNTR